MTDEQITSLEKIRATVNSNPEQLGDISGLTINEIKSISANRARVIQDARKDVDTLLQPSQKNRLGQIAQQALLLNHHRNPMPRFQNSGLNVEISDAITEMLNEVQAKLDHDANRHKLDHGYEAVRIVVGQTRAKLFLGKRFPVNK